MLYLRGKISRVIIERIKIVSTIFTLAEGKDCLRLGKGENQSSINLKAENEKKRSVGNVRKLEAINIKN